MSWSEITESEVAVNQIRSHYQTLDRYRRTSEALHGRRIESVYLYAASLREQVKALTDAMHDDVQVARWGRKFEEYLQQYQLVNE